MARKNSFTNVEGFQELDPNRVARKMIALSVEPKQGEWNPETHDNMQKTNAEGIPQWLVQVLFYPNENDSVHKPEVVPVTVTSVKEPAIRPGAAVQFEGFGAWCYITRDSNTHQITRVGRSFTATGFRQNGGE